MKELKFQEKIIKRLTSMKIWHFRYTASSTYGLPDIIAIVNGIFVGIELKRPDGKGKPSELQEIVIKSIVDAGGVAGIIDSVESLEELINVAKIKGLPN